MATTPGSRRRDTRLDITGDDRDNLTPMQEPLGSMDNPGSRTASINEVNLPPGETVRRTGNLGTSNIPGSSTPASARSGRSFTATFAIAAIVLLVAFLIALYLGSNRSNMATAPSTQAPVADTTTGTTNNNDTTGSTTTPSQQTAPGTGNAGSGGATGGGNSGTTTPPANP